MRTLTFTIISVAFLTLIVGLVSSQETVPLSSLPFSPARQAGNTLYLSGQIAVTSDGRPVEGSIADETRQTMGNLRRVLEEKGYDLADVISVTVYLADMADYQEMNAAYRTFFNGDFPARACVGGLQIAFGLKVEISCIAYKE